MNLTDYKLWIVQNMAFIKAVFASDRNQCKFLIDYFDTKKLCEMHKKLRLLLILSILFGKTMNFSPQVGQILLGKKI